MRRPKRNLNLSCETRSEPFFRRVLQICTHGLSTENPPKILFLHMLYRLYFAVREISRPPGGATVRLTLEKMPPSDRGVRASNRCNPAPSIAPFFVVWNSRRARAGRKKARMINRVASCGTVLARSRRDEFCLIDRSEKENRSFASGASIARRSISSSKSPLIIMVDRRQFAYFLLQKCCTTAASQRR